jgi:hypothetical protein
MVMFTGPFEGTPDWISKVNVEFAGRSEVTCTFEMLTEFG